MAEIIDGKKISQQIKDELKERAAVLRAQDRSLGGNPGWGGPGILRICAQ